MMCGAAQSLDEMVLFRLLQGMFGAALVPLSQATMLDIYPAEQRGNAMAIWGVGVMIGPILGPTLGGYLTEMYNWRFVFYINLPFGILATLGLIFFMPRAAPQLRACGSTGPASPCSVSASAAIQMMLDRGQDQDWFTSREIIIEAVLGGLGIYLFVVHMLTARRPFIPPALFKDRNFATGVGMMFAAGTILVSSSSLMAPWLQNLANYPVDTAGLIMAPRGIGTMVAMVLAGRVATRIDPRWLMGFGILCVVWSIWEMTTWTPDIDTMAADRHHHRAGLRAGLPVHPAADGRVRHAAGDAAHRRRRRCSAWRATSARRSACPSPRRCWRATPRRCTPRSARTSIRSIARCRMAAAVQQHLDPATRHGAAMLDQMINQQAQIIAYVDDYKMMIFTTLPALLLLFLMRRPRQPPRATEPSAAME